MPKQFTVSCINFLMGNAVQSIIFDRRKILCVSVFVGVCGSVCCIKSPKYRIKVTE